LSEIVRILETHIVVALGPVITLLKRFYEAYVKPKKEEEEGLE